MNRRQAAPRGLRTIDKETVLPAILQSGRAVGKSTEALRFHRSEPAKYLALTRGRGAFATIADSPEAHAVIMQLDADRFPLLYSLRGALSPSSYRPLRLPVFADGRLARGACWEFRRCRPVPVPLAIHDKLPDTQNYASMTC